MTRSGRAGSSGAIVIVAALVAGGSVAAQQNDAVIDEKVSEGIREHLEEAEDLVDSLLQWRHVLSDVSPKSYGAPRPTESATTLISVNRADVANLNQLIAAAAAMLPDPKQPGTMPRGDLRAHLEKAQEIARELLPSSSSTGNPVPTSGGRSEAVVTVDRTALLRLEVELDAAERVAPRGFTPLTTSR